MTSPTIITCAVTGSITSPAQHPGIPITPEQIADILLFGQDGAETLQAALEIGDLFLKLG